MSTRLFGNVVRSEEASEKKSYALFEKQFSYHRPNQSLPSFKKYVNITF